MNWIRLQIIVDGVPAGVELVNMENYKKAKPANGGIHTALVPLQGDDELYNIAFDDLINAIYYTGANIFTPQLPPADT